MAIRKPDLSLFIQAELDTISVDNVNRRMLSSLQKDVVARLASVTTGSITAAQGEIQTHLNDIVATTTGSTKRIAEVIRDSFSTGFTGIIPSVNQLKKETFSMSKEVTGSMERMKDATRRSNSAFLEFGKTTLITAGIIGVFMRAGQMLAGVARGAFGLAEAAAKLEDTERGFRAIASQTTNASLALIQLRQAAGGVIDDMTLLGTSTRAALSGLPVGTIPEIVESARALAAVTGRDVTDAIDRMVNAIAKQERRLLDELGIVVRANDLYADYARKHGIVASAMTATQKQSAFLSGTLTAVREKVKSLGGVIDETQRPFLEFRESIRNTKLALGEVILESSIFQDAIGELTDFIQKFGDFLSDDEKKITSLFALASQFKKRSEDLSLSITERTLASLTAARLESRGRVDVTKALRNEERIASLAAKTYKDLDSSIKSTTITSKGNFKISVELTRAIDLYKVGLARLNPLTRDYEISTQDASIALDILRKKQEEANRAIESYRQLLGEAKPVSERLTLSADDLTNALKGISTEQKKQAIFLPIDKERTDEIQTSIRGIDAQIRQSQELIFKNRFIENSEIQRTIELMGKLAQANLRGDAQAIARLQEQIDRRLELMDVNAEDFERIRELEREGAELEQDLSEERQQRLRREQDNKLALITETAEGEVRIASEVAKDQLAIMVDFNNLGLKNTQEIAQKHIDIARMMVEETNRLFENAARTQQKRENNFIRGARSTFGFIADSVKESLIINTNATETEKQRIREEGLFRLRENRQSMMRRLNDMGADLETRRELAESFKNAELSLMGDIEQSNSKLQESIKDSVKDANDAILRISESTSEKEITNAWKTTQEKLLARRAEFKEGAPEYEEITKQLEALTVVSEGRIRAARILNATKTFSDIQGITTIAGVRNMEEELARRKTGGEKVSQFEIALHNRRNAVIGHLGRELNERVAKDEANATEQLANAIDKIRIKAEENRFEKEKQRIEQQAADALSLAGTNQDAINQITGLKTKALAENEINRTISNQKLLLSIKQVGIQDDIGLKKQQALEEKQLRDAQAQDEITNDEKLKETLIENEKVYQRQVLAINEETLVLRARQLSDFLQQMTDALGLEQNRVASELNRLTRNVTGTLSGDLTSMINLARQEISLFEAIADSGHQKEIDFQKKRVQAFEDSMKQMREAARSMASDVANALADSTDVDFDKIVQNFIKSQVIERTTRIAEQELSGFVHDIDRFLLGPQEADIEREFQLAREQAVKNEGNLIEKGLNLLLGEEARKGLDFEKFFKIVGLQGKEFEADRRQIIDAVQRDLDAGGTLSEQELRQLVQFAENAKIKQLNLADALAEAEGGLNETREGYNLLTDQLRAVGIDIRNNQSRLDEIIPTAAFRAVTEPQANQMILLLSRQLAYLAQISTNTGVLPNMMNIMNGGRLAAAPLNVGLNPNMGLENAAAIDINMALNQDRRARAEGIPMV